MTNLSKEIDNMYLVDQSVRRDLSSLPPNEFKKFKYVVYTVDEVHHLRLLNLAKIHGLPTNKSVSKDTLTKFHVLILHQDEHPEFQKECAEQCSFSESDKNQILERISNSSRQLV